MDLESFEQINVSHGMMIDELPFMKEGMSLAIDSIDDEIIGVKTPVFVELAVKKSDPGVRGNTATGGTKPVELETGHIATVPLFVDEGDVLKIDTRTGEYVERVKQYVQDKLQRIIEMLEARMLMRQKSISGDGSSGYPKVTDAFSDWLQ